MAPTLRDYLADRAAPETGAAVLGLCAAAARLAERLSQPGAPPTQAEAGAFLRQGLDGLSIRHLTCLPDGGVAEIAGGGSLAVAFDPLDCAAELAFNAEPGSFFSIYSALPGPAEASFLRPGTDQLAAGCLLYGPRTALALTTGDGAALFTLDRDAASFRCEAEVLWLPAGVAEFAVNTADYHHWEEPVRRFIDDCLSGGEGVRARTYNMRWTGSGAAELHRILHRGGVYLASKGSGSVPCLIHHAHPVALLVEAAGGAATDGRDRILGKTAGRVDARSPLVFGSRDKVARIAAYHDLPEFDASPLFGQRGLFRH